MMAKASEGRLAYADLLRVLAMAAVVVLHVSAGWLQAAPVGTADWQALNLWDGLTRWCVPVFVMLSGMFLLDPKKGLSWPDLFLRYLLRMVTALLFWGVFYILLLTLLGGGALTWGGVRAAVHSVLRGDVREHLWFLYMMFGLYLVTPLLRAFVRGARRSDLHWFFLLTAVLALFLPTLLRLRPDPVASLYLERLRVHLVLGYVGFYVAGYYLKTYTIGRLAEGIIYVLGAAGAVATVWGTSVLSHASGRLNDVLYGYLTPNVAAMAVAVFVLFRYLLGLSDERSRRQRVGRGAKLTFGIYLVHDVFLTLLWQFGLSSPPLSPALAVPFVALAVFLPSFAVSWLLNKIPVAGRYLT